MSFAFPYGRSIFESEQGMARHRGVIYGNSQLVAFVEGLPASLVAQL